MGTDRKPLKTIVLGAALAALPVWVHAEVLVFKGENKWVAADDVKPLQALQNAARGGKTYFKVWLPKENRELAVTRLEVVRDILSREAKNAVVMEEVGTAAAGTLRIE